VWNVLWTKALINLMNEKLGADITPLTDAEISDWVARQVRRDNPAARRSQ
jgi:hypothetical protein